MALKFNELVEKMPAEARERAETKTAKPIAEYALDELREARSTFYRRRTEKRRADCQVARKAWPVAAISLFYPGL